MAYLAKPSVLSCLLLAILAVMLPLAQLTRAGGRPLPSANPNKNVQTARSVTPTPNKTQSPATSDKKQAAGGTSPSKTKADANPDDKKQTECFEALDHEGTVLIPGVGRYMIGSHPELPTVGGTFLGDSVPAALNGRYLPGNDDTFVPNPGYEVPNPARGAVP